MKNLANASEADQRAFFDSFDHIFSDVDGVLWMLTEEIPKSLEGVNAFKKIGKTIKFVSNNCTKPHAVYVTQLRNAGFEDDLITPALAITAYLKEMGFSKEIFVIGQECLKDHFRAANIKVAQDPPDKISERMEDFLSVVLKDNEDVGAVLFDISFNFTYSKLMRALNYLKRPEVLYLVGATDFRLPLGKDLVLLGAEHFQKAAQEFSGKTPINCAKPSALLRDYLLKKYNIADPSRVLFIGDSVPQDMGFAAIGGWKKLLVLSGLTRPEDIEDWQYLEEYKPDYYVQSLKCIYEIVTKLYGN